MANPEKAVLVCPFADAEWIIAGSVVHRCAYCHREVAAAPSGQAYLASHPGTVICCVEDVPPTITRFVLAASREVIQEEISRVVRNHKR